MAAQRKIRFGLTAVLADATANGEVADRAVIAARSASVDWYYNAMSRSRFAMARGVANNRRSRIALTSG